MNNSLLRMGRLFRSSAAPRNFWTSKILDIGMTKPKGADNPRNELSFRTPRQGTQV